MLRADYRTTQRHERVPLRGPAEVRDVPLAAIGWGIIFFDESHSIWIWAALALMILGVLLVNRPSKSAG